MADRSREGSATWQGLAKAKVIWVKCAAVKEQQNNESTWMPEKEVGLLPAGIHIVEKPWTFPTEEPVPEP